MSDELKACPFDGYTADVSYHGIEDEPDPFEEEWTVECWHCGCSPVGDYLTREKAIEKWNTRPTQEPLQVIDGLNEALIDHECASDAILGVHIDTLAKAAKAYQQALEKQEK